MQYDLSLLRQVLDGVCEKALARLADAIKTHERIFLCGAGRSGLMLKALAMRLAQAGRTAYVVGDCTTPAIEQKDLLLLASASGTTASVLRCAEIAHGIGATVCTITATPHSRMAELSEVCVTLPAPTKDTPNAPCVMGTLFEQGLLLLADALLLQLDTDTAKLRARHANLE